MFLVYPSVYQILYGAAQVEKNLFLVTYNLSMRAYIIERISMVCNKVKTKTY